MPMNVLSESVIRVQGLRKFCMLVGERKMKGCESHSQTCGVILRQ